MGHKAKLRLTRGRKPLLDKRNKQAFCGNSHNAELSSFASASEKILEAHHECLSKNSRVHVIYPAWKHNAYKEALSFLSEFTDKLCGVVVEVWEGGAFDKNSKAITISPVSMGFMKGSWNAVQSGI